MNKIITAILLFALISLFGVSLSSCGSSSSGSLIGMQASSLTNLRSADKKDLSVHNTVLQPSRLLINFSISSPSGIAIDKSGDIWIGNFNNGTVTKLNPSGSVIGTFSAGPGAGVGGIDASGNVWVANEGNSTVSELSPSGSLLGTFPVGGCPFGPVIDPAGHLWIGDNCSFDVTELNSDGSLIGNYSVGANPCGIAVDSSGNIAVAEPSCNCIVEINASGSVIGRFPGTQLGSGVRTLTIDANGNLWTTDFSGGLVTEFNPSGKILWNIMTSQQGLNGLAIDASGNLWVPILTEAWLLIDARLGSHFANLLWESAIEIFQFLDLSRVDLEAALKIEKKYRRAGFGFVDATCLALCEKHRISKIFTYDRKHFALYRPGFTKALQLFPIL